MTRRSQIIALLLVNGFCLSSLTLGPILGENGTLDSHPILDWVVVPLMVVGPAGAALMLGLLFVFLGRDMSPGKVTARALAGLLLIFPIVDLAVSYALSGTVPLENTDAAISAGCVVLAAGLSWLGFRSARAS